MLVVGCTSQRRDSGARRATYRQGSNNLTLTDLSQHLARLRALYVFPHLVLTAALGAGILIPIFC